LQARPLADFYLSSRLGSLTKGKSVPNGLVTTGRAAKTFIRNLSRRPQKCYVDALLHDEPDVASLVVLYAKISRMRVLSSRQVVESAEQLIGQVIDSYPKPAKTLTEIHAIKDGSLDIISNF